MSDYKYKNIDVPEALFTPGMQSELGAFTSGIDAAFRAMQGVPKPAFDEPEYTYYHDDDQVEFRWFRRVPKGSVKSTSEIFRPYEYRDGWVDEGYSEYVLDLEERGWLPVLPGELPDTAR